MMSPDAPATTRAMTPSLTHTHSASCLDMTARRRHWLSNESSSLPTAPSDAGHSIPNIVVHPAAAAATISRGSLRDARSCFEWPPTSPVLLAVPSVAHTTKKRTHSDSALYRRVRHPTPAVAASMGDIVDELRQRSVDAPKETPTENHFSFSSGSCSEGGRGDCSPKMSWLRRHSDSVFCDEGKTSRSTAQEEKPQPEMKLKKYLQRRYQRSLEAQTDDDVFTASTVPSPLVIKTELEPAPLSPYSASPRCQRSVFCFDTTRAASDDRHDAPMHRPTTSEVSLRRRFDLCRHGSDPTPCSHWSGAAASQPISPRPDLNMRRPDLDLQRPDPVLPLSPLFGHFLSHSSFTRLHAPLLGTLPMTAWSPDLSPGGDMRVVKQETPPDDSCFPCSLCGQVFTLHSHRERHIVKHLDVAPPIAVPPTSGKTHPCHVCGRAFARSDMLTRHARLHTGAKPYACSACGQVFSRSDHLRTHVRTHTGERPYACPRCSYTAPRRDMITRHMRVHAKSWSRHTDSRSLSTGSLKDRAKKYSLSSADSAESEEPDPHKMTLPDGEVLLSAPADWAYMGWGRGGDSPLSPSARSTDSAGEVQRSLQRCSMAGDSSPSGSEVTLSPARLQLSPSATPTPCRPPGATTLLDTTDGTYFKYTHHQ